MNPQSKGEMRVGIAFNPSGNETVNQLKRLAADFIDAIERIPGLPPSNDAGGINAEIGRCKALAQTEIESAAMWAVKAATKAPPAPQPFLEPVPPNAG